MTTRTGIELHEGFCRLVEIDPPASRQTAGRDVRVRRFLTRISVDPQSPDFSRTLADIRSEQRLAREATVVVWGLRSSHRIVRVPQAADAELERLAVAEAKEEIGLLEADGTRAAIAATIGADVRAGSHPRREVSLTAASGSDLARRVQPIVDAGFDVVRVVTPAMALCAIAR